MGAGSEAALQIVLKLKNEAEQGLTGLRSQFTSLAQSAAAVGAGLTAGVTVPLVAIGKKALDTAMDYESAMNLFQATTGATGAQMKAVGDAAIKLGADMSLPATSAADAGTAMLELAKAGLSVDQSLAAAKGTLQLAAAGQLGNAQAAEIAANALNAFKLSGDQATMVADLLAAAANASSGSVYDMADSLKMTSAVASAAGIPIQDVVANISQMANAGMKGSDAGTSLKQMLLALQAPTKKSAGLMAELGLSVYDAQGTMLPMRDIIGQFSTVLGGLTQQQRNAALATIFGSDAVRAANVILMGGVDAFDQMSAAVTRQGAAQELAAAQMKGLKGALAGLGSQVETLMLQAALPFMGVLERLARGAAELVGRLQETNPEVLKAAIAFAAVFAAAGPIALAIAGIATAIAFLLSPLGLLITGVAVVAAAFAGDFMGIRTTVQAVLTPVIALVDATIKIFQAWYEKTGSVAQAIMGALNGLGLMAPALQPVITKVQEFGSFVAGLVAPLQTFGSGLRQIFTTDAAAAAGGFNQIIVAVGTLGEKLGLGGEQAWLFAGSFANALYQAKTAALELAANVQAGLAAVGTFLQGHAAEIQTVLSVAWGFVVNYVQNQVTFFVSLIQAGLALLRGDWEGAWTLLGAAVQAKFGGIIDFITGGTNSIRSAFETLRPAFDTVVGLFETLLGTVVSAVSTIVSTVVERWAEIQASTATAWNAIIGAIGPVVESIVTTVTAALGVVKTFIDAHGQDIMNTLIGAWNSIMEIVSGVVQIVQAIVTAVFGELTRIISNHGDEIQTVLSGAWEIIKSAIDGALGVIKGLVNTVLAVIKGDWEGAWEAVKDTAESLWNGIKGIISGALDIIGLGLKTKVDALKADWEAGWNAVKTTVETLWGGVEGFLSGIDLAEIGRNIIQGLINGILSMAGAVGGAIKGVVDGAVAAAKNLLGIESPSKVFAEIGADTILGFIAGVDKEKADAAKAVADAMSAVVQAIGDAVGVLGALGGYKDANIQLQIWQVSYWIGEIVNAIAHWATLIEEDAQKAAKALADNAKPVVDLVGGALETLGGLAGYADVDVQLQVWQVSFWIGEMVNAIGYWAGLVAVDAQTAAKAFAESAKPVVDLIGQAVDTFGAIVDFTPPDLSAGPLKELPEMIATVVGWVGAAAAKVKGELAEQAGLFADRVKPVLDLLQDAMKAIEDMGAFTDLMKNSDAMEYLPAFVEEMVKRIGEAAGKVGEELAEEAARFADLIAPVFDMLKDTMKGLLDAGKFQAKEYTVPALAMLDEVAAYVTAMVAKVGAMRAEFTTQVLNDASWIGTQGLSVFKMLKEAIKGIAALAEIDLADMSGFGFDAGLAWITALADGIRSGMSVLEAALKAVADMFPHSPAKTGPLRREPDWNKFLLGGLLPAAGQVGQVLGGIGVTAPVPVLGSGPALAPAPVRFNGGGGTPIQFVYAPTVSLASEREAQEVIAPLLAEVLRREKRRS